MLDRRVEILKTLRATPVVLRALVDGIEGCLGCGGDPPRASGRSSRSLPPGRYRGAGACSVRRMVAEEDPELAPFDQETLAEARRYLDLDLEGELACLEQLRHEHLALLEALAAAREVGWGAMIWHRFRRDDRHVHC